MLRVRALLYISKVHRLPLLWPTCMVLNTTSSFIMTLVMAWWGSILLVIIVVDVLLRFIMSSGNCLTGWSSLVPSIIDEFMAIIFFLNLKDWGVVKSMRVTS